MPKLQVVISEEADKALRKNMRRKGDLSKLVNRAILNYLGGELID